MRLLNFVAVRISLFSTAALISARSLRLESSHQPSLVFKYQIVFILSDCECSSHYFNSSPDHKYRVLYTGSDLHLLKFLQSGLKNCFVVRAPSGYVARIFIAGQIDYSLFLFDEKLSDATGADLECFTRARRECTPLIIFKPSDSFCSVVKAVTRSLEHS